MASTAVSQISRGEFITHLTGVRMRVNGSGSLLLSLYSFDDVNSQVLVPFTMATVTNKEPFRLANFKEQRIKLRLGTTEINEQFKINRIIFFHKPLWTSYPGTE